jgi:hypothetical protein
MNIFSILGVIFVIRIAVLFFKEIGKSLPMFETLLLISGLQWIIGAFNSYRFSVKHFKYYMRVEETDYMSFVVPAFLGFGIILLRYSKTNKLTLNFNPETYIEKGRILLFIGIFADLFKFITPPSLHFFIYLISLFKYVGASILLFSKEKRDRYFFYGSILYLLLKSIQSALFHDLILWGLFFFLVWALKHKPSFNKKIVFTTIALTFVVLTQSIKSSFRKALWEGGYDGNKISLYIRTIKGVLDNSFFSSEEDLNKLNIRLNQGWHISSVLSHVPFSEPFANGATVVEATSASILPRFLNPNKKIAGGKENYERFTGNKLGKGTSMGISIIGEAYANFGRFGGILFMLFFGFFLSWVWFRINKIYKNHPILLFFIPLLFIQVVKAETELFVVLNHLLKASFVVWLFFRFAIKILKWKI